MEETTTLCNLCNQQIDTNVINDHLFVHINQAKETKELKKQQRKQQKQKKKSLIKEMDPNMLIEYWMLHYLQASGTSYIIGYNMVEDLIELFLRRAKPCGLKFTQPIFWTGCNENSKQKYTGHKGMKQQNSFFAPVDKYSIQQIYTIAEWQEETVISYRISNYLTQLQQWQFKGIYRTKYSDSQQMGYFLLFMKEYIAKQQIKLETFLQNSIKQQKAALCIYYKQKWQIIQHCGQKIEKTQIFCDKCAKAYKFKLCERKDGLFEK